MKVYEARGTAPSRARSRDLLVSVMPVQTERSMAKRKKSKGNTKKGVEQKPKRAELVTKAERKRAFMEDIFREESGMEGPNLNE